MGLELGGTLVCARFGMCRSSGWSGERVFRRKGPGPRVPPRGAWARDGAVGL